MGRTTTVPAVDTYDTNPSPTSLTMTYYADDMVHTETQDGMTDTFSLDPAQRVLGQLNSSTGLTATNIYADSSDSPAWISNSNGTWSRNITDLAGDLAENETAVGTTGATLQLVNLHGDVVATAPDSTSDVGYSTYSEDTEFGSPRAATGASGAQYAWLGGKERSSAALGGTILMGERVYDPVLGRFLQTDPVQGGSANNYDYCDQDPINNIDLGGTFSKHVKQAWKYFRSQGYSKKVTAAIIGNLRGESGTGLSPTADNGAGCHGIAQWCGDRWSGSSGLEHFAAKRGASPYNFQIQLKFINHELQGGYSSYRREANGSPNVTEATKILEQGWERCGTPAACHETTRVNFANAVYARFA
jgi:RHS repeat-associated protein